MLPVTLYIYCILFFLITLRMVYLFFKFILNIFFKKTEFKCVINKFNFKSLFFLYIYDFFYIFSLYKSFDIFYNYSHKLINFKNRNKLKLDEFIIIILYS